jgi:hypothetical protein
MPGLSLRERRPRGSLWLWLGLGGGLWDQGIDRVIADHVAAHDQRRGLPEEESAPLVASVGIRAPLCGGTVLRLGHDR